MFLLLQEIPSVTCHVEMSNVSMILSAKYLRHFVAMEVKVYNRRYFVLFKNKCSYKVICDLFQVFFILSQWLQFTGKEVLIWLKTHAHFLTENIALHCDGWLFYATMDLSPRRMRCASRDVQKKESPSKFTKEALRLKKRVRARDNTEEERGWVKQRKCQSSLFNFSFSLSFSLFRFSLFFPSTWIQWQDLPIRDRRRSPSPFFRVPLPALTIFTKK